MGKIISLFDNWDNSQKGSIAINIAMSLAEQTKENIAFVDLCLNGSGFIEQITGYKPEKNINDLVSIIGKANESLLKGYIPKHSSGVAFVDGVGLDSQNSINPEKITEILSGLSKTFSFVILMLPDEYNDYLLSACSSSHLILASIYPQMLSLARAKKFGDTLSSWHFPLSVIKCILNRINSVNALDKDKIRDYLGIELFAEIPYDLNGLLTSVNKSSAQISTDPHSDFSIAVKNLAKNLLKNDIYTELSELKKKSGEAKEEKSDKIISEGFDELKLRIHKKLVAELGAKKIDLKEFSDVANAGEIKEITLKTIQSILSRQEVELSREDREQIAGEILDEALGLGCIEKFLKDKDVTEIMVNGPQHIYVEKKGKIFITGEHFLSNEQLMTVIDRIVSPIGRRVDESSPIVDARLADGSRVNAIIAPLSLVGPVLTIRKFAQKKLTVEDLIGFGALNAQMADFLRVCVQLRKNIIVSGGTGSGKTTLLNVISSFIPPDERIVTIEDSAELKLPQEHVVRLESRPPSIEGKGEVPIRRLVINALRMRPDRIVVGECRGGETLDMLQAMNTGHDGSMTTIHANTPKDGISRITTMVIMAGTELPEKAIREQIFSAVNIIVQLSRLSDGTRKIVEIAEVKGIVNDSISLSTLFKYEQTGIKDGKVTGRFVALGNRPTFVEDISIHGLDLDLSIFKQGELR